MECGELCRISIQARQFDKSIFFQIHTRNTLLKSSGVVFQETFDGVWVKLPIYFGKNEITFIHSKLKIIHYIWNLSIIFLSIQRLVTWLC